MQRNNLSVMMSEIFYSGRGIREKLNQKFNSRDLLLQNSKNMIIFLPKPNEVLISYGFEF